MVKHKEQTWPNDYKLIVSWISYLWKGRHKKEKDVSEHDKTVSSFIPYPLRK